MAILATAVALVGASILLWAGLEKARAPASTASTLGQLGVPASLAGPAAGLVVLAELAVALGLVFRPDSALTLAGVVLLAGAFALAGLLALRRGEPVPCTCFGAGRGGYLGENQVRALVPWVGGAAFLYVADVASPSPSGGAAMLAGVGLAMAGVRLIAVLPAWREARGDRRSARETYLWLRR